MQTFNMHYAKTHLSKLVEAASKGEAFVIARAGKPLVKVEAVVAREPETAPSSSHEPPLSHRRLGFMAGEFTVPGDIKTPFKDEIEEMFYGEHE